MAQHTPVLSAEVLTRLHLSSPDIVVDATLGGGGHACAMLEAVAPDGVVIGLDADPRTLEATAKDLQDYGQRFRPLHANFRHLDRVLPTHFRGHVAAVLFDLGLSSIALADAARGFSFQHDGPLDMRFDPSGQTLTATEIVNTWSPAHLQEIFSRYGQERSAGVIIRRLVEIRERQPFTSTAGLAEAIASVVPRRGRIHPATKVFQALRMAVNDELGAIAEGLPAALAMVRPGGYIAVITFHSVEDTQVKVWTKTEAAKGTLTIVNKHVIVPERAEVLSNPRARSAKLRIIQKK